MLLNNRNTSYTLTSGGGESTFSKISHVFKNVFEFFKSLFTWIYGTIVKLINKFTSSKPQAAAAAAS